MVPSEVFPAFRQFSAIFKREFYQFEKLFENTLQRLCAIAPGLLKTNLKELILQGLAWTNYLFV